ncbi:MAG: tetratricopeptide repeat protein [Pirellulaceae bacterium]
MAVDQQRQENDDDASSATSGWREAVQRMGRHVRSRVQRLPRRNVAIIGFLVLAVVGLGTGLGVVVTSAPAESNPITLEMALAELDSGHWEAARQIAADLRLAALLPGKDAGGPAYVLGVVMAHDAENHAVERERRVLHLLAARYLEESQKQGFPSGREGYGEFELGKNLYHAGLYAASIRALSNALESHPRETTELCRLLSGSYLRESDPQLEKALEFNRRYLSDEGLSAESRDAGLLMQGRILIDLNDLDACYQTLSQIDDQSPLFADALLLKSMLLMEQADQLLAPAQAADAADAAQARTEAAAKYEEAKTTLRDAQQHAAYNSNVIRQSQYLMGVCYRKLGDPRAALNEFSRTSRANFDTPEGLAAGLEEADLQRLLGDDAKAIEAYRRVLRQAADMQVYYNRWISLDVLRARIEQAYRDYLAAKAFPSAIELATIAAPILPSGHALRLQADAHAARAEQMESEAAQLTPSKAGEIQSQARTAWRQAGRLYADLAKLRFATRQYPGDLWASAEHYLRGHDYARAVAILEAYLKNVRRQQRPPALTLLGQALLALNRPDEALEPLNECVELYPRDPHSYRARLIAAQANLELNHRSRARELLLGNLEHESLTPRSIEWRESLYALGKTLYWEGLHHEMQSRLNSVNQPDEAATKARLLDLKRAHDAFQGTIKRLSEAIARDEAAKRDRFASETIEARYLLAEARRRSAKLPKQELSVAAIETTRVAKNRQIQKELGAAIEIYRGLQSLLNEKQEQSELSELEKRILRNCYFARADALFDLEQYAEAIQAYSTATNRYQHEPESLEAYVQIANCHRQLHRPFEARGTLEQAKVVLDRIRPDADFTRTTRYGRKEWKELLDWLSTM